jgi:hypothetical protein
VRRPSLSKKLPLAILLPQRSLASHWPVLARCAQCQLASNSRSDTLHGTALCRQPAPWTTPNSAVIDRALGPIQVEVDAVHVQAAHTPSRLALCGQTLLTTKASARERPPAPSAPASAWPTTSAAPPSPHISAVSMTRQPMSSASRTAVTSAARLRWDSPKRQVPRPSAGQMRHSGKVTAACGVSSDPILHGRCPDGPDRQAHRSPPT